MGIEPDRAVAALRQSWRNCGAAKTADMHGPGSELRFEES